MYCSCLLAIARRGTVLLLRNVDEGSYRVDVCGEAQAAQQEGSGVDDDAERDYLFIGGNPF